MRTVATRDQLLDWMSVLAGLVVAFLLIAPLFTTLAWDEELGPTPGLALIGLAVLVMVGAILRPGEPPRHVHRLRNALVVLGVGLSAVGLLVWR